MMARSGPPASLCRGVRVPPRQIRTSSRGPKKRERFRSALSSARKRSRWPTSSASMNMILHGIEAPNILHTNTLAENLARCSGEGPLQRGAGESAVRGQGTQGGSAELPDQARARRRSCSFSTSSRCLKAGRPRRHRDQEHLPVEYRQRFGEPAQAPAGDCNLHTVLDLSGRHVYRARA
jgi:hypothetical protein